MHPQPLTLDTLIRDHRDLLIRFFRRELNNHTQAEDLTQEVFTRLLRHPDLGEIGNPTAYLLKTAHNVLTDHHRQKYGVHLEVPTAPEDLPEMASEVTPEQIQEARQLLAMALEAMEKLPPECRKIFHLHRVEGLTYPEIAQACGISESGVKQHIMRALRHLQARMGLDPDARRISGASYLAAPSPAPAAAQWYVRMHGPDVAHAAQSEFEDWLLERESHVRAYVDLDALCRYVGKNFHEEE